MTWKTYTKAISEAGLESGTQAQILIKLFKRAGYINKKEDDISESTAKKWISGARNCKVSSYFPEKENVNIQDIYKFFHNRPKDKLVKVQQIFRLEKDDNSSVDCDTEDMDRLCWSLVNQFLDLLGFEREDIPNIASGVDNGFIRGHQGVTEERMLDSEVSVCTGEENKRIPQDAAQPECMLDIFIRSFEDFGIQDFLEINPLESIKPFCIEDAGYFVGRIKTNQERGTDEIIDKDGEAFEKISRFTEILLEYLMYLKNHMKEKVEGNRWIYYFKSIISESEFNEKTDDFRQQLKSLYKEINVEAEKISR